MLWDVTHCKCDVTFCCAAAGNPLRITVKCWDSLGILGRGGARCAKNPKIYLVRSSGPSGIIRSVLQVLFPGGGGLLWEF